MGRSIVKNRIRSLVCGHTLGKVVDYGDDYRWVVRCTQCGQDEHWTQREWRSAQPRSSTLASLIRVSPDAEV